jgi:hypothetical protein
MVYEEYVKELEFIGEKLAYVAFTDEALPYFESRGVTEENVDRFNVTFFFSNALNDEGKISTDCVVRFSVFLSNENSSNQELTFVYNNNVLLKAIIDKIYKPEFDKAYIQHHTFKFGKPNIIKLYDAQFILEEKLGLEGEEW